MQSAVFFKSDVDRRLVVRVFQCIELSFQALNVAFSFEADRLIACAVTDTLGFSNRVQNAIMVEVFQTDSFFSNAFSMRICLLALRVICLIDFDP